jgi:beta-galactosidase
LLTRRQIAWLCLAAFITAGLESAAFAGDERTLSSESQYASDISQIKSKLALLENAVTSAREKGIEVSYEQVTLTTAREFLLAIRWDITHPQILTRIVSKYEWLDKKQAPDLAAAIPKQEVSETLTILDYALAELAGTQTNSASLRMIPATEGPGLDLSQDFCRLGNRPVFLSSFIWMPDDEKLNDAFGRLPSLYLTLKNLQEEGLKVRPDILDGMERRVEDYGRCGVAFEVFLDQNPPAWAAAKYPEIVKGRRQFIGYDIDNPKVREMWQKYLAQVAPLISKNSHGLAVYMLANEPNWFTTKESWSTGPVSDYTFQKFHKWLASEYQSNIGSLNKNWGTQFASFDAVHMDIPMSRVMKGSAIWYDWCRFNMDRVNEWFVFLKAEIRKNDPQALCMIKPVTDQWYDTRNERDGGLDYESFAADIEDVCGADTAADAPLDNRFRRFKNPEWAARYVCGWESQSMYYDFLKSLAPKKIIFDCEYHAFSAGDWRALSVDPRYVRTILWLAHLHGMGMNLAWYWPRQRDGEIPKKDANAFFGSTGMQPQTVDAYGRTMKELNVFAPEIAALSRAPRPVRLFYSTDSEIQSPSFVQASARAYESSYFLGTPIGFVTSKMMAASKVPDMKTYPVLIVPSATHVSDDTIVQLKRYVESGGTIVVFGGDALAYDEHGHLRDTNVLTFLDNAVRINLNETVESIATRLESLFKETSFGRRIVCRDQDGKIPWGVHYVSVKQGENLLVYMVNVGKESKTVSLSSGGKTVETMFDLFNNRMINVEKIRLEPYDMKFLSVPCQQ